jgi:hypothetical protein
MRYWERRVLITGAGGFIGSHLVERLLELGAEVRAFVRYNSRNDWGLLELVSKDKLGEVEVIVGDLRDNEAMCQAAEDADIIFHLASLIAIPYSYLYYRSIWNCPICPYRREASLARSVSLFGKQNRDRYDSGKFSPFFWSPGSNYKTF